MRTVAILYAVFSAFILPLFLQTATASPIPVVSSGVLDTRQSVTTPVVVVDGGDIGEFSPIEDGFLEGDNDSGGETADGGDANSVANGLTGGGAASSSQSNGSATGTSSFCSLTSCATSGSAANHNSTSTSSSSSSLTLFNGPVVSGPLVQAGRRLRARVVRLRRSNW